MNEKPRIDQLTLGMVSSLNEG